METKTDLRAVPSERTKSSLSRLDEPAKSRRGRYIGAALFLAVVWFAWPYVTVYRLAQAINRGDEVVLTELVDWPAIRTQIREIAMAQLATEVLTRRNREAEAVGAALASAFIGPMIDNLVTPRAIATLRQREISGQAQPTSRPGPASVPASVEERMNQGMSLQNVRWAAPSGLTSFTLVLGNAQDPPSKHITAIFEFRDLGWKLARIYVPAGVLARQP